MTPPECCSQERPHLVVPYDVGPHWIARRASRLLSGVVVWEQAPAEAAARRPMSSTNVGTTGETEIAHQALDALGIMPGPLAQRALVLVSRQRELVEHLSDAIDGLGT